MKKAEARSTKDTRTSSKSKIFQPADQRKTFSLGCLICLGSWDHMGSSDGDDGKVVVINKIGDITHR